MATQTMTFITQAATSSPPSEPEATSPFTNATHTEKAMPPSDPFHDLVAGYPKLAGRMGVLPEIAMFRRFGALNARNILYMQNELVYIENQLKQIELEDSKSSNGKRRFYRRNSFWLTTSNMEINGELRDGDTRQRDLVLRMRALLKDYNHALIQQSTILREMGNPDSYDIDDIQHFLSSDKMTLVNDRNETANALIGADRGIWGTAENKDTKKAYSRELVVLRARKDIDTLSRTIGNKAIDWIMKCGGRRWKKVDVRFGKRAIHDETIFRLTFWFTSGIASILPVVSIILLVKMESLNGRLGLIATFNVIISLCLTLFTEARRTDVFAVTAAFAAVQVVFVGQVIEKAPQEVIMVSQKATRCVC